MSWGLRLCGGVLATGDLRPVIEAGITIQHFVDPEAKMVYEFVHDYYYDPAHPGEVPGRSLVEVAFPTIKIPTPADSMTTLCQMVIHEKLSTETLQLITEMKACAQSDPKKALEMAAQRIALLQGLGCSDGDQTLSAGALKLEQMYLDAKYKKGLPGIPWAWDYLNERTKGMCESQMYMFYGVPKAGKTWFVEHIVVCAYAEGARCLVYSPEMRLEELQQRAAGILAAVDMTQLDKGLLSKGDEATYLDALHALHSQDPRRHDQIIFVGRSGLSLTDIEQRIRRHRPDLVFLDSIYLVKQGRMYSADWKDLARLMEALRQINRNTKIPFLLTSQENVKTAAKMGHRSGASIGYTQVFLEQCDLVGNIICTNRPNNTELPIDIGVVWPGTRNCRLADFTIAFKPAATFGPLRMGVTLPEDAPRGQGPVESWSGRFSR